MPTVPIVRSNSVQQQPISGVRVNTNQPLSTFGGGEALNQTEDAIRGMNRDVVNFAIKQKQDADQIRIQKADLDSAKAQTDIQMKVRSMEGENAFGAPDFAEKEWKTQTDKIRQGLSNDAQRKDFDRILAVRSADLTRSVGEHVYVEGKKYDTALTEAYVKNSQDVAANNFMDTAPDGQIAQALFQQEEAIKKFGARHGVPAELVKKQIDDSKSKTHAAVIDQMLMNNNDQLAADYFKQNNDAIQPEDRPKIEKAIQEGILLGEGQRSADQIFVKSADNRNHAFDLAKKIKDPELRKKTEDNLENMFTRRAMAQREENLKNYQLAYQLVEKNQQPPGNITANLTPAQKDSLNRRQKQVNAGVNPGTDWPTYYNLKMMAADQRNEFVKENLLEYRNSLSDTEFKELVGLQTQISKNDATAQSTLNGFRTSTQVVNDTLASAGIDVRSKRAEDQKRVALFRRSVDENIQILQDQTGKKAKSEDVQKIADSLLITAIKKRPGIAGWLDREKKVFEVQYKDVPEDVRGQIMDAIKRHGQVPTERSVVDLYLQGLRGKSGR